MFIQQKQSQLWAPKDNKKNHPHYLEGDCVNAI